VCELPNPPVSFWHFLPIFIYVLKVWQAGLRAPLGVSGQASAELEAEELLN